MARTRWDEYFCNSWAIWVSISEAAGYMLLGLWFTRRNLFQPSHGNGRRFFRKLLPWMVATAMVGKAFYLFGLHGGYSVTETLSFVVGSAVGGPALGLAYLCGLRWVFCRESGESVSHKTEQSEIFHVTIH